VAALFKGKDTTLKEFTDKGVKLGSWKEMIQEPLKRPQTLLDTNVVVQGDRAWVTCLETRPTMAAGSANLATQTFRKKGNEWMLIGHRFVPYGKPVVGVKNLVLCDASGCITKQITGQETYRGSVDEEENFKMP